LNRKEGSMDKLWNFLLLLSLASSAMSSFMFYLHVKSGIEAHAHGGKNNEADLRRRLAFKWLIVLIISLCWIITEVIT
jgi:hypothetical protein